MVDLDYRAVLERPPTPVQFADYQAACARLGAFAVLNSCRVLHSFRTGDAVQSKFGSAAWALRHLSARHHAAIRAALATYRGHAAEADTRLLTRGRAPLFSLVDAELAQRDRR